MQQTRLKIAEASKLYGIARTTIYKKIKDGKLSIDTDKRIDLSEMMRVFGAIPPTQLQTQATVESVAVQDNTTLLLHEKIASLEKALAKAERDKVWLQQQVEANQQIIKLLEHKTASVAPPPKQGLFNQLVKAITG